MPRRKTAPRKGLPLFPGSKHPFADLLGLTRSRPRRSDSQTRMRILPMMFNPIDCVHGGVIFSLIDNDMAGALLTQMAPHERCTTVEAKINYLRPATKGTLVCTSRLLQRENNVALVEAEVHSGKTLIAKGLGTYLVFVPRPKVKAKSRVARKKVVRRAK